jgi:hypothetical protein
LPNTQGIRNDPWESFLTTVDAVETLTGYDFFSNLPEPIQRCVEAGTNGNNPPLDTDADGVPDTTDNCPFVANANQANYDNDSMATPAIRTTTTTAWRMPTTSARTLVRNTGKRSGCPDADGDGIADANDNCPGTAKRRSSGFRS